MLRKVFVFVLVVILSINLSGCIPIILDEYYEISQPMDQIQSIAIYARSYEEDAEYNELCETPLVIIPQEDFSGFIAELEAVYCKDVIFITIAAVDPSFYFGDYVVQIDYIDSSQEFVSNAGFQYTEGADGSVDLSHYSYDRDQWDAFISKYVSGSVTA